MPARKRGREVPHGSEINLSALDTKVNVLDNDIVQINTRIEGLDTKFDRVMTGFASEFRSAIASLSTQLSEKNKTPWAVLISGMGLTLGVVSFLGHQTLAPITDTIAMMQTNMVPRKESDLRYTILSKEIDLLHADVKLLHDRAYQRLKERLEAVERENNILKYPGTVKPKD